MKMPKSFDEDVAQLIDDIQKSTGNKNYNIADNIDMSDYLMCKAENKKMATIIEKQTIKIEKLENKLEQSQFEIECLNKKIGHNIRNAGRKKMHLTEKYKRFASLYEQNYSLNQISSIMKMSMRSCYYYKKEYETTSVYDQIKKQEY